MSQTNLCRLYLVNWWLINNNENNDNNTYNDEGIGDKGDGFDKSCAMLIR